MSAHEATELASLRAAAELLGRLLVREVEAQDLRRLREADVAAALEAWGIALPAPADEADWIEERAAEYHDLFLRPEAGPLVQSLWTQGRYEGDAAVRVRQLAEAAALELDREAARGAAVDHLGCLLLLWASAYDRAPAVATAITQDHIAWSARPLGTIANEGGFYGAVATATLELTKVLTD